jgi:aminoglycoside phosphotransferase (APT) family kinase protein
MTTFQLIKRTKTDFQRALTPDQLLTLCTRHLSKHPPIDTIQELSGGMFNNAFLIQRQNMPDIILRVGPHPEVTVFSNETLLLRREYNISSAFTPFMGLTPETIATDFSHSLIDRDVVFQTFLTGELWDGIKEELTPAENHHLWQELGCISAQIHAVQGSYFGQPDPMPSYTTWNESIIAIAKGMWQDLHNLSIDDTGVADYIDLLEKGNELMDEITTPMLIHGDLWPKNVLVDRSVSPPKISGLIDAERAMWGDPAAEWIYYFLDIPDSYWVGNGRFPTTPGSQFRHHAYQGLYDIQILLEAWRFHYSDKPFRQQLNESCQKMKTFL